MEESQIKFELVQIDSIIFLYLQIIKTQIIFV